MKSLALVLSALLLVVALFLLAVIVYYWPVIDRVNHICDYYPELLSDCKEVR